MSNELILLISALVGVSFVFVAARLGSQWLLGTIVMNLTMIGIFGGKLISFFGLTTNAGNVFYACVFLATHFLLERSEQKVVWNTIFLASGFVIVFSVLSQLAVAFHGLPGSELVNSASTTLFSFSSRVVVGSIIAFVFAQYINISLYEWLRKRTKDRHLWLRSSFANCIGQLADSSIFFSIVFFDLSGTLLLQIILAGWLVKIFVVELGVPFLYLDRYLRRRL